MNQQTGEDLDPRNREGRFPKGGGKQKKQKTEAACQRIQKCDCGFRMEISSVAQVYKIILYIYIYTSKCAWLLSSCLIKIGPLHSPSEDLGGLHYSHSCLGLGERRQGYDGRSEANEKGIQTEKEVFETRGEEKDPWSILGYESILSSL